MRGFEVNPSATTLSEPLLPRILPLEQLLERRSGPWVGSQILSGLAHVAVVVILLRHGISPALFSQRPGAGFQFGQAVMLTSPLFELGDRNMVRGNQNAIPLSALVPERRLIEPDLRKLNLAPLDPPASTRPEESANSQGLQQSPSALNLPTYGGGGALPSGGVPEQAGSGPVTPFDVVPPSNSRDRERTQRQGRIVIGDASVLGGGAQEGLRLPPSPRHIGSSVEIQASGEAARLMEEHLRLFISRFRRACYEAFPERLNLGAPGETVLSVVFDRGGRIRSRETAHSSGNAVLDRQAREALSLTPAFQELPAGYPEPRVHALVRVRYGIPKQ